MFVSSLWISGGYLFLRTVVLDKCLLASLEIFGKLFCLGDVFFGLDADIQKSVIL